MTWRVTTRLGKGSLEVIDPADWDALSSEEHQAYQVVSEFDSEQDADKYAVRSLIDALPVRPKTPKKPKALAEPATIPGA
ncbi:MAG: hypothetical protein ACJ8F7_05785 [Gemmataceae bacterium]